jgi:hypothetical protein
MNPRRKETHNADAIAGAALITIGAIALIVRLGLFTINSLPLEVLQWWPLLLIVIGVGLWAHEQEQRGGSTQEREAKYVR